MKRLLTAVAVAALALFASRAAAGVTISFACESTGQGGEQCKKGAEAWAQKTGNTVNVIQVPNETGDRLALYQQQLGAKSADVDVYMIDVIWPGLISQHLLDQKKYIPEADIKGHFPAIVQNNTVGGRLVGMPWFTDAGLLYYRTDLLQKYGYSSPPTTWEELATMAKKIQDGERASNPNFYGFVFQGNAYEGLTCDALEWLASSGAGSYVDAGKVTINNAKAVDVLNMVRGWIGTITPRGVTSYQEEDARNAFDAGNAAFMRNWPYAYAASQTTPVKGKFDVTVLPHGPGGTSVGTVGGWQLGVSKYSKHIPAAIEWVRYLTSPAVEKFDAIFNSNVPTIASVASDPAVVAANPYLKPEIANV